jgi:hypothetical protein
MRRFDNAGRKTCAVLALAAVLTAGGCDNRAACHPGDVKARHGHTLKCGPDGRWHL